MKTDINKLTKAFLWGLNSSIKLQLKVFSFGGPKMFPQIPTKEGLGRLVSTLP